MSTSEQPIPLGTNQGLGLIDRSLDEEQLRSLTVNPRLHR